MGNTNRTPGKEEYRHWGPLLPPHSWDELLTQTGFSGTDLVFHDYQDPRDRLDNVMVSTAVENGNGLPKSRAVSILVSRSSELQQGIASKIKSHCNGSGVQNCDIVDIKEISSGMLNHRICVSLLEVETFLLKDIKAEEFETLQCILESAASLLWVTRRGDQSLELPANGMVTGLFRCIRCENGSAALITVGLESPLSVNRVAGHVMRIVANISTLPSHQGETEYEERDGRLCINRVTAANHLNRSIHPKPIERSSQQKFGHEDRALALRVGTTGLLDTLDFVQDTQSEQRMAPDEVEVKVKAVGVNFKDVLTALGQLPEGELGLECAGIVTRAYPGVKVVPGDRVCVTALGTYRTNIRIAARQVHKIPDHFSFSEAAALPVVYCTAYQALYECARISPRESILIHSGAGGTGQAAIQLSKLADAEIFVTVGSEDKKRLIMDLYAIPEDHIFASRGLSFKKGIKRMTKGRGVDIVLNSLSGERLQASWDCLAPFGRFIEIGKHDIIQGSKLSMLQFAENRTFTAIDLVHMLRERPTLIEKTMQAILTLAESGRIKSPQPLHIYSISDIEGAFRYLQGGTNTGKTTVEIDDDAMVLVSNHFDNHMFSRYCE